MLFDDDVVIDPNMGLTGVSSKNIPVEYMESLNNDVIDKHREARRKAMHAYEAEMHLIRDYLTAEGYDAEQIFQITSTMNVHLREDILRKCKK
jgi:hypothetical protein